jgi:hypothetical protein
MGPGKFGDFPIVPLCREGGSSFGATLSITFLGLSIRQLSFIYTVGISCTVTLAVIALVP